MQARNASAGLAGLCTLLVTLTVGAPAFAQPLVDGTYYYSHNYRLTSGGTSVRDSVELSAPGGKIVSVDGMHGDAQVVGRAAAKPGRTVAEPREQPSVDVQGSATSFALGSSASISSYMEFSYSVRVKQVAELPVGIGVLDAIPVFTFAMYFAKSETHFATVMNSIVLSGAQVKIGDFYNDVIHSNCVPVGCNEKVVNTTFYFTPLAAVSVMVAAWGTASVGKDTESGPEHSVEYQAFADPLFEIDPSFAYRDYFALEFSPNLEATAPIPEPETYAMLAAGLLLLGAAARRRARKA